MAADLDRTLAALADPTRRAIVERLRSKPQRPSEVAEALSMSRPAMSRHLRVLRKAGLISQELLEDDARAKLIQLRTEPLSQLRTWVERPLRSSGELRRCDALGSESSQRAG